MTQIKYEANENQEYPKVAIIIINWNSGEQLRQCLASIEDANRNNFTLSRVCVVDNASQDNSLYGIME
jgi:hypothetical protein